jgi:hypothetical protein
MTSSANSLATLIRRRRCTGRTRLTAPARALRIALNSRGHRPALRAAVAALCAAGLTSASIVGAHAQPSPAVVASAAVSHTYTADTAMIPNPERGFFQMVDDCELNAWAFSVENLTKWRTEGYTLVQCVFYLQGYRGTASLGSVAQADSPLALIDQRLRNAKAAGVKLIMRFAYTKSTAGQDAPHTIVMAHIDQIAPLLTQYKSVVHVLQEGFIGTWGEGYYSLNYNTVSVTEGPDWPRRNAVLGALLAKLPQSMMVQVRTPQMKQEYLLAKGVTTADTATNVLPAAQAWNGSDRARIGFVNDCFLKDGTDTGTYREVVPAPGISDRAYMAAETNYVMMGGETCGVATSDVAHQHDPECKPPPVGARALSDLKDFHWSYLNRNKPDVVDGLWVTQGCYGEIVNRLGYRFLLVQSSSSVAVVSGRRYLSVSFTVRNDGWAAPTSLRPVRLLLRERGQLLRAGSVSVPVAADPRKWAPGTSTTVNVKVDVTNLPSAAVYGGGGATYDAFVQLPDSDSALASNLAYAMRFANIGTWTAYGNKLQESYTTPVTPPVFCC